MSKAEKTGSLRVPLGKCVPNSYNPNVMPKELYKKLKVGLKRTLEEAGRIPPIVVRPKGNKYEIIDGFHRWKALQEIGEEKIAVYSIKVADKTARILTNTLNYLRGNPDRAKYAKGIVELIENGATVDELTSLLPEDVDGIDALLDEADISFEAISKLEDQEEAEESEKAEKGGEGTEDVWIDLKFRVTVEQARVIESEVKRLSAEIKGKNKRGRALEFMAASSQGTPISGS